MIQLSSSQKIKSFTEIIAGNKPTVFLLLLACVGAFLRFKGLTFQSYWNDEAFSALVSDPDNSLYQVYRKTVRNVHPPLYQALLWVWYKIFGYTEFAGRSLSAVAGVLFIPAIYFLGKELFDKRVGLCAATIATFNYFLIRYSQETRSYSLLILLIVISFIFFVRLMRNPDRTNRVRYIVLITATVYTHYYGLLVFASQVAFMLAIFWSREGMSEALFRSCRNVVVTVAALLLPLVPYILKTSASQDLGWIKQPGSWYLVEYFKGYLLSEHLAIMFGFFLVLGVVRVFRLREKSAYASLAILGLWFVFIYILPYLKGMISSPMLHVRYSIAGLPALIILIAAGICSVRSDYVRITVLALASLMALLALHNADYYGKVAKEQFREVVHDIIAVNVSNMPLYGVKGTSDRFNVYFKQMGSAMRVERDLGKLEMLLDAGKAESCFWLIDRQKYLAATDFVERYRLHIVGTIEKHNAGALLLSTQGPRLDFCPKVNHTGVLVISNVGQIENPGK